MLLGTAFPPKQPSETFPIELDFKGDLAHGEHITGTTTTARALRTPADATATFLAGDDVVTGSVVAHRVRAGTPGEVYRVQMRITTSGDNTYEHEADIPMEEV